MDTVAALAAVALGVVFVLAGASKVAAGARWPIDAAGLGVSRSVAVAVPWVELVVGAALVVRLVMPAPAIVALVLLVAMTAVILRRLAGGDRPPCACFGAWSARPIGAGHVVRNVAFVTLAVIALWA